MKLGNNSNFLKTFNKYVNKTICEWTILNENYIKKGCHYRVKCRCSCGKEKFVDFHLLLAGKTASCGHLRNSYAGKRISEWIKNNPHPLKKAHGEAAFNMILRRYKKSASERDLNFELSVEEFKTLINGNCFYCNKPPIKEVKHKDLTNGNYLHNGIDRLDNNKSYTKDNCVSCCTECNFFKRDLSYEKFIEYINIIYKNRNEK